VSMPPCRRHSDPKRCAVGSRRRTSVGFDRLCAAFLIVRFRIFYCAPPCGEFSVVCSPLLISCFSSGVFRLCGGDGGSAPRPHKPSGGGLDPPLFNLRPHFCLAFHFVPLKLFFLPLASGYLISNMTFVISKTDI